VRRQAPPPLHRLQAPPLRLGGRREPLQRAGAGARQPVALEVDPALEVRGVGDVEAVEQRPAVFGHRVFQPPRLQRLLERAHVAAHHVGRERDLVAHRHEDALPQLAAEDVERLGEGVAGGVGGVLGPEQGDHLLAPHRPAARHRQDGEEGDAALVRGPAGDGPVGAQQDRIAENLEREHGGFNDHCDTRREKPLKG
jgi:hypothetical protein